jgi:hypothetical protein
MMYLLFKLFGNTFSPMVEKSPAPHGSDERTVCITRLCRSTQSNVLEESTVTFSFVLASENKRGLVALKIHRRLLRIYKARYGVSERFSAFWNVRSIGHCGNRPCLDPAFHSPMWVLLGFCQSEKVRGIRASTEHGLPSHNVYRLREARAKLHVQLFVASCSGTKRLALIVFLCLLTALDFIVKSEFDYSQKVCVWYLQFQSRTLQDALATRAAYPCLRAGEP